MIVNNAKSEINSDQGVESLQRFAIRTREREEAESFLSKFITRMNLELAPASLFDFEAAGMRCGGVSFGSAHSRSGIEMSMVDRFDGYAISSPTSGTMLFSTGGAGAMATQPNDVLVVDLQDLRQATFGANSGWQRIALRSEELHAHVTLLTEQPVTQRVKFRPHPDMKSGVARTIFAVGQAVVAGTRGNAPLLAAPAAIASLRDAVFSMFVEGIPHSYSHLLGRRVALPAPKSVRRAIDFMHAHAKQSLQLEDIARAAQTSSRSLQMAFRNFRNVTPMEYLRRLRLDGARNDLVHCPPGTTVAEVAYRWGFAHHGMFSASYAKAFGERPSVTLRHGAVEP